MATVRIKKYASDDYYWIKEVSYTTLVPSIYNLKLASNGNRREITDGFNFDKPGQNLKQTMTQANTGQSYFLDRETAFKLVHPEDKHILDELVEAA